MRIPILVCLGLPALLQAAPEPGQKKRLFGREEPFDPSDSPYYNPDFEIKDPSHLKNLTPQYGSGRLRPKGVADSVAPGGRKDVGLRDEITLSWKDYAAEIEAQLDANWTNVDELKVINMEDFSDALEKVNCTHDGMFLDFSDQDTYEAAIDEWDWVNAEESRNLVIFANHPECSSPNTREIYRVENIVFDHDAYRADFKVTIIDSFDDFMSEGQLEFNTIIDTETDIIEEWVAPDAEPGDTFDVPTPLERPESLQKRDLQKRDLRISLNHNLSGFKMIPPNPLIYATCEECKTRGYIRVSGRVKWAFLYPKEVSVDFNAEDVGAYFKVKLGATAGAEWAKMKPFLTAGVVATLYKIIDVELIVEVGVGVKASLDAEVSITLGAEGRMSDGLFRHCFWGCSGERSGWGWQWNKIRPEIGEDDFGWTVDIEANIDIFLYVNPRAGIKIFGKYGFEGGIGVLAPKFHGSVGIRGNQNGGVCDHPRADWGVDISLDYGVDIYAYVGNDMLDTWKQWPLYLIEKPFYDLCVPLSLIGGSPGEVERIASSRLACTTVKDLSAEPRFHQFGDYSTSIRTNQLAAACNPSSMDLEEALRLCLTVEAKFRRSRVWGPLVSMFPPQPDALQKSPMAQKLCSEIAVSAQDSNLTEAVANPRLVGAVQAADTLMYRYRTVGIDSIWLPKVMPLMEAIWNWKWDQAFYHCVSMQRYTVDKVQARYNSVSPGPQHPYWFFKDQCEALGMASNLPEKQVKALIGAIEAQRVFMDVEALAQTPWASIQIIVQLLDPDWSPDTWPGNRAEEAGYKCLELQWWKSVKIRFDNASWEDAPSSWDLVGYCVAMIDWYAETTNQPDLTFQSACYELLDNPELKATPAYGSLKKACDGKQYRAAATICPVANGQISTSTSSGAFFQLINSHHCERLRGLMGTVQLEYEETPLQEGA